MEKINIQFTGTKNVSTLEKLNLIDKNGNKFDIIPYKLEPYKKLGVIDAWQKYHNILTYGKNQTMAIIDDGCDLSAPEWQTSVFGSKKVLGAYNSIDKNNDPSHGPNGYHGTSVGYPSSLNYKGICGIAYNNNVVHIRGCNVVNLIEDETEHISDALQWIIDNYKKFNITTIQMTCGDNKPHTCPMPTIIDEKLLQIKKLNIWISAPCGNRGQTTGICWPACQENIVAVGTAYETIDEVFCDRYKNTDIVVSGGACSFANANIAACAMILREAIEINGFDWRKYGKYMPDAILKIFQITATDVYDSITDHYYKNLNFIKAVDFVFENK